MLTSVYLKSLRDQRWALLGWGIGVVALVLAEAAVWPTLRDMRELDKLLESYPQAMRDLFDLDAMSTGTGFMNAELFTLMMPMLFIIFGVSRGARTVAGDEEAGTLDAVLVTPMSTRRLVVEKFGALATSLAILGTVLVLVLLASSVVFGLGIGLSDAFSGALAMVLLGVEYGAIALAVGAATGHRSVALAVSGAAAVAGYVLYALGLIVDRVAPWQPLSPFEQALGEGPLGADPAMSLIWVVLGTVVVVLAAIPLFGRRDLRTH
jgi:ABC-2 type transport system permease protein